MDCTIQRLEPSSVILCSDTGLWNGVDNGVLINTGGKNVSEQLATGLQRRRFTAALAVGPGTARRRKFLETERENALQRR